MTKSNAPVSSFGPELQNALRAGANAELRLNFDDPKMAIRFIARINALRAAMRREKHPDTDRLYRAGVSISRENPKCVIIAPKDSEFRDILRTAGVKDVLPSPSVNEIEVATPRPGVVDDPAATFLAGLTEATRVPQKPLGESTASFDLKDGGEPPTSEIGVDTGLK